MDTLFQKRLEEAKVRLEEEKKSWEKLLSSWVEQLSEEYDLRNRRFQLRYCVEGHSNCKCAPDAVVVKEFLSKHFGREVKKFVRKATWDKVDDCIIDRHECWVEFGSTDDERIAGIEEQLREAKKRKAEKTQN